MKVKTTQFHILVIFYFGSHVFSNFTKVGTCNVDSSYRSFKTVFWAAKTRAYAAWISQCSMLQLHVI